MKRLVNICKEKSLTTKRELNMYLNQLITINQKIMEFVCSVSEIQT